MVSNSQYSQYLLWMQMFPLDRNKTHTNNKQNSVQLQYLFTDRYYQFGIALRIPCLEGTCQLCQLQEKQLEEHLIFVYLFCYEISGQFTCLGSRIKRFPLHLLLCGPEMPSSFHAKCFMAQIEELYVLLLYLISSDRLDLRSFQILDHCILIFLLIIHRIFGGAAIINSYINIPVASQCFKQGISSFL